jgi:hypothetical protein
VRILLLSLLFCVVLKNAKAQIFGCTDHYAINFNANATENDGSCVYNSTSRNATLIKSYDSTLNENSALVSYNGKLFTINDSGNSTDILEIDSISGTVVKHIKVLGTTNVDWEALAVSNKYLYIADFGNNYGNRTNLVIYRVPVDSLADSVQAEFMYFILPDQTSFTPNAKTNFDMEAMLHVNDTLYLFTKQWGDLQTKLYMLPTWKNTDTAILIDSFNVACLITDASIDTSGKIILLGYDTNGQSYTWMLSSYVGNKFFSGHKRKINLGLSVGQAEGILLEDNNALITCERFSIFPPSLFRLQLNDLWPAPLEIENTHQFYGDYIGDGKLHLRRPDQVARVEYFDNVGSTIGSFSMAAGSTTISANTSFVRIIYKDKHIQMLRKQ